MERMREQNEIPGFANIDDLGGKFLKYGPGMSKWGELIADAKKNNWDSQTAAFKEAFSRGDIATMERMREQNEIPGFANINDLGGNFSKYGSGMSKWGELIADAKKNKQ